MKVFLTGFMGCGKTTLGKLLAQKMGLEFFDTDDWIEKKSGESIVELFEKGEANFRTLESQSISYAPKDSVISLGGGFFDSNDPQEIRKQGMLIFIDVGKEDLTRRLLNERENRPLIKDLSDVELRDYVEKKREARLPKYCQADWIVSVERETESKVLKEILNCVGIKEDE